MELPLEELRAIAFYGRCRAPEEACGIIVGGKALACANLSHFPKSRFELDSELWLKHDIQGFYHSHPEGDKGFSEIDLKTAQFLQLPSIVYILATDTIEVVDNGEIKRYENVLGGD